MALAGKGFLVLWSDVLPEAEAATLAPTSVSTGIYDLVYLLSAKTAG